MRSKFGVLSAPGLDIAVYSLAVGLGHFSSGRAQILSWSVAMALAYGPELHSRVRATADGWTVPLALRCAAAALLVFFIRSGLMLDALGWGWWPVASLAIAAIATALMICAAFSRFDWIRTGSLGNVDGWEAAAVAMMIAAAALRVVYGARVELLPEETYYWNYAQHLDIGYLDHPPMVAWLISAGTRLFGSDEFGVRAGALCTGAIATFFTYRLTDNLFGRSSALLAALLMQTLPFFFLSGMLMTPDAPLTAAWAASLYFLERALVAGREKAWWGAGLCLGLGLLSKYTIALLGLSALIFAVMDPIARRGLRRFAPYAAAVLALAVFSPVLLWNSRNGWASFLFQTSHRLADRPQFALHKLVASALVLLTPSGLAAAAQALARRMPGGDPDPRRRGSRFLQVAMLTPLAVFVLFSFRHEVKLDWTGAPWVAVVPLIACGMVESARAADAGVRRFLRRSWVPTLLTLLLVYGAGLYDLTWGIPGVGYGAHAELVPVGWRQLGADIDGLVNRLGERDGRAALVVGMDRYAIASELAFYAPDQASGVARSSTGHLFGQVGLMYERWFPPVEQKGRDMVLVAWKPADLDVEQVTSAFDRLGAIEEGKLMRGDEVIRRYYYRVGSGYRAGSGYGGAERQDSAAD